MHKYPPDSFLAECETLVRRSISACPELGPQIGSFGKFIYLVRDTIGTSNLEINDLLAQRLRDNDYPEKYCLPFAALNEAIRPYIGRTLLRCGIWHSGVRYELYINEEDECIVHQNSATHPDPDESDT